MNKQNTVVSTFSNMFNFFFFVYMKSIIVQEFYSPNWALFEFWVNYFKLVYIFIYINYLVIWRNHSCSTKLAPCFFLFFLTFHLYSTIIHRFSINMDTIFHYKWWQYTKHFSFILNRRNASLHESGFLFSHSVQIEAFYQPFYLSLFFFFLPVNCYLTLWILISWLFFSCIPDLLRLQ